VAPPRPVSPLDDLEDTYGPYETQQAPATARSSLVGEEAYNGDVERTGSITTVILLSAFCQYFVCLLRFLCFWYS
jgi:hypothetical protein